MSMSAYPKYRESGSTLLGAIPSDWPIIQIKRIARLAYGDALPTEARNDAGEVPVFGSNGPVGAHDTANTQGPVIVVGRKGSYGAINWNNFPVFVIDTAYFVDASRAACDLRWLLWALHAANLGAFSQDTGVPGLARELVHELAFVCPSQDEQSAIATFLDRETGKIDALVAEQERLIALLKEKRQAVISQAVTKGLDLNAPMKDSGVEWLGEVPAHWEVKRVKSVSSFITSGPRGWSERVQDEGALFIQSGDLGDDLRLHFEAAKRVPIVNDAEAARTRLANGDVVVCITGAKTGNVALCEGLTEDAFINQHLSLIRPKALVHGRFLGAVLKAEIGQRYFEASQYGLKQGLSLEDVGDAPLVLPPLHEQQAILAQLNSATIKLDTLTTEAHRAIALLKERRAALISAAVTGKIDVRGLVAPDEAKVA